MSVFVYAQIDESALLLAVSVILLVSLFIALHLVLEAYYSDPYVNDEELARLCDDSAEDNMEDNIVEYWVKSSPVMLLPGSQLHSQALAPNSQPRRGTWV
eukprot:gnl/MRDRNA2_/MRDRNA2_91234_c0_seq1.p2 gnl/MRDRNA2_/MRDRNA2_91234_c0~~gnl/MRDRNA2_/MRDRNA2_91234_c0_seq1.p2  ORF type:complete len:100 (+),score=21.74 gnl/MRDRNA2_/MRDRNA2_91234_c0_seq1:129-428(+)